MRDRKYLFGPVPYVVRYYRTRAEILMEKVRGGVRLSEAPRS